MTDKISTGNRVQALSRQTLGSQRTQTVIGLNLKTYGYYVAIFIIPFIFCPILFLTGIASENIKSELSLYAHSYSYSSSEFGYFHLIHDGEKAYIPGYTQDKTTKMSPSQARSEITLSSWGPLFLMLSLVIGGFLGGNGIVYLRSKFEKEGEGDDIFVRGGRLISVDKYKELVYATTGASKMSFGGIPFPKSAEFLGLLITGSAGSGKSNELRPLMEQSFSLGQKSIVYDPSGSFTELYFRPGIDILLAPANQIRLKDGTIIRSVGWSILKEVQSITDGKLVADSIVPSAEGQGKYWSDSARVVLSSLLLEMRKRGHEKTGDILKMFLESSGQELIDLLASTQASALLGDLSTTAAKNVVQTVSTELAGLELVKDGEFSIRDFIRDQDSDARLFITAQVAREALMPLYRVVLTLAFNELSLMPEANNEVRCAFFLDEFASLGKLPTIAVVLNEMRKYGASLVCVSQTTSLVRDVYGNEKGKNLMSSFQNLAIYRTQTEEEEKLLAGLLGKQEVIRKNNNLTIAVQSNRDGMSENMQQVEQYIVHPSELHLMRIGQCYVRFSGTDPVFLDNSLNGDIVSLTGFTLKGKTAKPNRKFTVFDRNNERVAVGVSDDQGDLSIEISGEYTNYKDFYLVVPPEVNPLNEGLSVELNPDLALKISSIESRQTVPFPVTLSIDLEDSVEAINKQESNARAFDL